MSFILIYGFRNRVIRVITDDSIQIPKFSTTSLKKLFITSAHSLSSEMISLLSINVMLFLEADLSEKKSLT